MTRDRQRPDPSTDRDEATQRPVSPGKRTLTEKLPARRAAAEADEPEPARAPIGRAGQGSPIPPVAELRAEAILRKASGDAEVSRAAAHARIDRAGRSTGAALPGELRGDLETSLGRDLSAVRVHTGDESATAADALQARAYAVGQDIHFGAGAYDPGSEAGKHLIAHEVAHTAQQAGGSRSVQRSPLISRPGDAAEVEADRFADAFTHGGACQGIVSGGGAPSAEIHCYERDEHRDIPTTHLFELQKFLATPEGEAWAKRSGYDAKVLLSRMQSDPVITGKDLHGPGNKGTTFSYGEVTALMGDLYSKWEDLGAATPEKKKALMEAKTTSEYQKLSGGKYLQLAKNNDNHFAGKNLEAWHQHHLEAIELALTSGSDPEAMNQALFIDAAGAHYLTDAFSAGHQFVKSVVLQHVNAHLASSPIRTRNPQMQAYVGMLGDANVAQMIMKNIHDRMNVEGFMVTNGKGMTWKTLGDGELAKSPETQHIAALAVFESRQQVLDASRGKLGANLEAEIQKVADFFPDAETQERANLQAIGYIPDAARGVEDLIYRERGSAPEELGSRGGIFGRIGGHIVESNLDAVGDPGREQQILRNQEIDRATGRDRDGGRVEPSFTLGRF